jgi:thiamine biosynthesis lipoprotein
MGTVINIKLFGFGSESYLEKVEEEINGLETSVLSWRKEGSDVYRINASAGSYVSVSPDAVKIISQCMELSDECDGVFDLTIGKVTQLWDFGGDNQRLPSDSEIQTALADVGYESLKVSGKSVYIDEGQALDLGSVGKGFACDKIKELLEQGRTKSAVVSVGGSLLLYGNKTFSIGIVNPENDQQSMGTLRLKDVCVSTSGSYEKYFEQDGKTYHHILNATTGYPAVSEFKSVTVVSESGLLSDALSTICFIIGYRKSIELLEEYDAEAVFIFNNNAVKVTDGLSDKFTLTDSSFTLDQ